MSCPSLRLAAVLCATIAGCQKPPASADVAPTIATAAQGADAITIYEELESLIATGSDSEDDRQYTLDRIRSIDDDETAGYAFARAAVLGRVAELRGVKAGKLVTEAEQYARLSIARDAEFRERAATRMLGSLYVMAPPRLIEHGDSEEGLELLEDLAEQQPEIVANHLRLAEAFVHLDDPDPGLPSLCVALAGRSQLRPDESALLDRLVADVGGEAALGCAPSPTSDDAAGGGATETPGT